MICVCNSIVCLKDEATHWVLNVLSPIFYIIFLLKATNILLFLKRNYVICYVVIIIYMYVCIYPLIVFTEALVIGVEFVIVLILSFLCLLVVVWMLMKFVNNGEYYDFLYVSCIHLFSWRNSKEIWHDLCA